MKNLTLILICFGLTFSCFAQKLTEDDVPIAVKSAWVKKYPNVKHVKWEKEAGAYEASFDFRKEEVSALFDASGYEKEVETEIEVSAMPTNVKNSLAKDYSDFKVKETARIVSQNATTYEVEVKKGKESFDLIFSEEGKLLQKETKKKEKD